MVRKGFEQSEETKYAHGTGGLAFLSFWRESVVRERDNDTKAYGYPSLDTVLNQKYAWFEHFGEGLWARFAILLEGPLSSEPGKSRPLQYSHEGPLPPGCFVVDVAFTHTIFEMAMAFHRQSVCLLYKTASQLYPKPMAALARRYRHPPCA